MELFASRGYFFCRYCGSFHFPETKADEGVRIVGETPEALECAVCQRSWRRQWSTRRIRFVLPELSRCTIARTGFAAVVEKRRAWATGTPAPPVPLNRQELERKLRCPACKGAMITHPYFGPGNVVIDSCEACAHVWLDFGELRQIVDAPGRNRGTREVPRHIEGEAFGNSLTGYREVGTGSADALDLLARIGRLF